MVETRHPISKDGLGMFLANHSIIYIIIMFLIFYIVIIFLKSFALYAMNFSISPFMTNHFVNILIQSAIYVLGGDANDNFHQLKNVEFFKIFSKLFALIIPTLLLGALVYKVVKPQKSTIVFPRRIALDTKRSTLETCYYIATRSEVFDLQTQIFARYYKPTYDNKESNPYPLTLVKLREHNLQKPFSFVPTRVMIPVLLTSQSPSESEKLDDGKLLLVVKNNEITHLFVDGQRIDPEQGEFCQIVVIVKALIPDLQTTLVESKTFYAFQDLVVRPAPIFKAEFDHSKDRYETINWEDFEI